MSNVHLPKPLEEYFAVSEDSKTGDYRRFHLYLPYRDGSRIERLHREWKISGTEEAVHPNVANERLEREKSQFKREIERWLGDAGKVLVGDAPIAELRSRDDV